MRLVLPFEEPRVNDSMLSCFVRSPNKTQILLFPMPMAHRSNLLPHRLPRQSLLSRVALRERPQQQATARTKMLSSRHQPEPLYIKNANGLDLLHLNTTLGQDPKPRHPSTGASLGGMQAWSVCMNYVRSEIHLQPEQSPQLPLELLT